MGRSLAFADGIEQFRMLAVVVFRGPGFYGP
jgi:hypothetical protein